MDICQSYRPRLRRNILSTQRKMKVLSALDSDSRTRLYDSDSKSDLISDHGREVMALIKNEQFYVEVLKDLKKFFIHPVLKGNIESLADIIGLTDEMLAMHSNLYNVLLCGKSNLTDALNELSPIMDVYVSYSILISLESTNFQKFYELISYNKMEIIDLLHEPMAQIFRYTTLFQNLYSAQPNETYGEILKAAQYTSEKIKSTSSMRKNAVRTLQIQRLLVKRQPKILSPGRTVLKEGILYKVSSQGSSMKRMAFFLFNDILLCCKILFSAFSFQEKDSLLFSTLFPLNSCTAAFVMGSSTSNGALFKVTCGSMTYLLLSKIPGESQGWVQELQTAIRTCQNPHPDLKSKLIRRKNICIKQRLTPLLKKTPRVLEKSVKIESMNMSEVYSKPSTLGKLLKLLTCTQL